MAAIISCIVSPNGYALTTQVYLRPYQTYLRKHALSGKSPLLHSANALTVPVTHREVPAEHFEHLHLVHSLQWPIQQQALALLERLPVTLPTSQSSLSICESSSNFLFPIFLTKRTISSSSISCSYIIHRLLG